MTGSSLAQATMQSPWSFGGYGEFHANFAEGSGGNQFDIHRVVFYTGYEFDSWLLFNSELEIEHSYLEAGDGGEIAFEQAYVDMLLSDALNVRFGRVLIPLGIVNKRHEPPTYNGVERPIFDRYIIPTTWWSDGAGVFGSLGSAVRYELYALGGLDGSGISATSGIRGARVKERPSLNEPAITGRVDAFPFAGALVGRGQSFRIGASAYYSGLDNGNKGSDPGVDGSMLLVSGDAEYRLPFVELRGVVAHGTIDGAASLGGGVAEEVFGYSAEAALRVWPESLKRGKLGRSDMLLFARYDKVDTQFSMPTGVAADPAGERAMWTVGASFLLMPNFVIKVDHQIGDNTSGATNVGAGWYF